ncbi:hypothetical protein FQR65_LT04641 [Abscondita terminalis]|nr:hypothetical protein FQR65_LT04641 [Abscondita terminalis]
MSSNSKKDNVVPVNVYVRVRPFNENEQKSNIIQVVNSKDIVVSHHTRKKYSFDGVFGSDSNQISVYNTIAKPLISEVLSGYNCTVFAYGQTGSGKTFTMTEGISSFSSNNLHQNVYLSPSNLATDYVLVDQSGLIPRVLTELFQELRNLQQQYTVQCSYLEIYNEDLRDLLSVNDDPSRIKIYDDTRNKGAVMVQQIEETTIHNTLDGLKLLKRGHEKRHTAITLMNDRSSRSHAIFTITVHTRETRQDGEQVIRMGKINLVDLAGSENINRSGASDRQAREAGNINQSLLTLGRVIKALSEKRSHIPFRESKLTRILKDSLGGKTKTSIIATISPCLSNLEETLSTLDYASRARGITNKPETNERISEKQMVKHYMDQIKRLQKDLEAARTGIGICLDSDNYEKLISQHKSQENELSIKSVIIKELETQLKLVEEEKRMHENQWIETCVSFEQTRLELQKMKRVYENTERERREQEYLAQKYIKSAALIHTEANGLLNMIKKSTFNEAVLCQKVTNLYGIANANNELFKSSCSNMIDRCFEIQTNVTNFTKCSEEFNKKIMEEINDIKQRRLKNESLMELLKSMINCENIDTFDKHVEVNGLVRRDYKDYVQLILSSQEQSNKDLRALQSLVTQNEEKRRDDLGKLSEILKGLEHLLSQKRFIKKLQNTQNHSTQAEGILIEGLGRLERCTDAAFSEITKSEKKVLEGLTEQLDQTLSKVALIKKRNFNNKFLIEGLQDNVRTEYLKLKNDVNKYLFNFIHKTMESKRLTRQHVKERFRDMIAEIANDENMFVDEVMNNNLKMEKLVDSKIDAICEDITESSNEYLLTLSKTQICSEEIFKQLNVNSENSKQFNTKIRELLNQLESKVKSTYHV